MAYNREEVINYAPGGDSVKSGIEKLDTDLTGAFTHLNTIDTNLTNHAADTGTHGVGSIVGVGEAQTLTNKTLTTPTITLKQSAAPTPTAEGDIQWDTDGDFIVVGNGTGQTSIPSASSTHTLTNKTISLASNTVSGTLAQFNAAVSDADLASLAGSETLTNKTLTAPVISSIVNTGTLTLPTSTDTLVGRATTDTLTNKTLTSPTLITPVLGTPASGDLRNCSLAVAPAIGGTTPSTGAFTALTTTGNTILGDASTDTVTVNGYMGVGGAGSNSIGSWVRSAALTGTNQTGTYSSPTGTSAATTAINAIVSEPKTAAAAFTCNNVRGLYAVDATLGADSTITNLHGLYVDNMTKGTNNYGITSLVSSGTNKWNIYASGTAANYFAGNLLIGTTTDSGYKLRVNGEAYIGSNLYQSDGTASVYLSTTNAGGVHLRCTTAHPMAFSTNATERMRIAAAGNILIGTTTDDGVNKLQVNGTAKANGFAFPATQVASSDPNTLDDYEEGTGWTPVLSAGSSTFSYAVQVGTYTKVGRIVFFQCRLGLNTTGNTLTTDYLQITGLPFFSNNTQNTHHMVSAIISVVAVSGNPTAVSGRIAPGETGVYLYDPTNSDTIADLLKANYLSATGGCFITCSGFYIV